MYKFNDTKDWILTWFDYTEQNYFAFSFVEFSCVSARRMTGHRGIAESLGESPPAVQCTHRPWILLKFLKRQYAEFLPS